MAKKKRKRRDISERLGEAFDQAANAAMDACNKKFGGEDDPRAEACRFKADRELVRLEKKVRLITGLPADPTLP